VTRSRSKAKEINVDVNDRKVIKTTTPTQKEAEVI
jgi:hypothetical protein